jgi:hypothetical protein
MSPVLLNLLRHCVHTCEGKTLKRKELRKRRRKQRRRRRTRGEERRRRRRQIE